MQFSVIDIGNSKGIRLPKKILEQYNIEDTLEVELKDDKIILKATPKARQNWEIAFKQMRKNNDDELLIGDVFNDENIEKW